VVQSWTCPSGLFPKLSDREASAKGLWVRVSYPSDTGETITRDVSIPKSLCSSLEWNSGSSASSDDLFRHGMLAHLSGWKKEKDGERPCLKAKLDDSKKALFYDTFPLNGHNRFLIRFKYKTSKNFSSHKKGSNIYTDKLILGVCQVRSSSETPIVKNIYKFIPLSPQENWTPMEREIDIHKTEKAADLNLGFKLTLPYGTGEFFLADTEVIALPTLNTSPKTKQPSHSDTTKEPLPEPEEEPLPEPGETE